VLYYSDDGVTVISLRAAIIRQVDIEQRDVGICARWQTYCLKYLPLDTAVFCECNGTVHGGSWYTLLWTEAKICSWVGLE